MKASLARLGIRGLNPTRRDALARLARLRTGDEAAIPPLRGADLAREMARLALVRAGRCATA
jgi:hypothetical protein